MQYVTVLLLSLFMLLFQNCTNAGFVPRNESVSKGPATVEDLGVEEPTDEGPVAEEPTDKGPVAEERVEDPIEEPIDVEVITDLCESQQLRTSQINIRFEKPQNTCDWGQGGNLGKKDRHFQARIEQKRNLELPAGAVICSAQFEFVKQDFRYDDHFLLLFNKSVIASSYDFSHRLNSSDTGLLQYEWDKLAGMNWNSSREGVFCSQIEGAAANCDFPGHDEQGFIELEYSSKYIQSIMSAGVPEDHSFTMVSVGDNDNQDCEHSDVEFTVEVSYAEPQQSVAAAE